MIISNYLWSRKCSIEKEVKVSVTKFRPAWDPNQASFKKSSTYSIPAKVGLSSTVRAVLIPARETESSEMSLAPEEARRPLFLMGIPFLFGHIDLMPKRVNGDKRILVFNQSLLYIVLR